MKACSFKAKDLTVVVVENEHKEVKVFFDGFFKEFPSYNQALKWAKTEELHGNRSITNF